MLRGHARDVLAEAPGSHADDLAPHADAVGGCNGGRGLEPLLEAHELPVEMRVERQLALEDCRPDEDDSGTPICCETAGEIDCMLGLFLLEQRHDDAAVRDRAREAARAALERSDVRELHRNSWYGTEARITCGSTSSSRFT